MNRDQSKGLDVRVLKGAAIALFLIGALAIALSLTRWIASRPAFRSPASRCLATSCIATCPPCARMWSRA